LLSLSGVYVRQGMYNDALKRAFDAQEKSDKLQDDKLATSINSNLGYIYLYLNDNQRALYYYQRSIKISQKTKNEEQLVSDYNSMGLISSALNKNNEALQYYEKGHSFS
jgi:tetratricopeptide (TPR) repeat protein